MNSDQISKKFIGAVEDEWQLYSDRSTDYTRGAPIGFGASSTVYAAHYHPSSGTPIPCALKVLDLDSMPPHALSLLNRETQLMSLSKHPNVLRVRGTWIDGHKLYIAMRLMNKGSAADVMRYGWPGGMDEEVVRCILKQALEGLNYLHMNGLIHRDVKAANLLIDDDGTVLLGDLGVAASLVDDHHDQHKVTNPTRRLNFDAGTASNTQRPVVPHVRPKMGKRKSFVGTPCWMAPELIQGRQYDSSADIWSFGITALELTQGRPPRSRESPHAVLLQTVQGAPPTLNREGGQYKYSRSFKEIVESCLVKDPSKRPTAEQLLQAPFFRSSKKKSYLVGAILNGLPPLTQRQERRARPTSVHHGTIDSWDFSLTASPTTSLYKRPAFLRKTSKGIDDSSPIPGGEGVFEFEAEVNDILSSPDSVNVAKEVDNLIPGPLDLESDVTPSPPEMASSVSSASSSPLSEGIGTSAPFMPPPIDSQMAAVMTTTSSASNPIPVPSCRDSNPSTESHNHRIPSSNPDPSLLPALINSSLSPLHPSTSAPPNLAPPLQHQSLWRKLTGGSGGSLKTEDDKQKKGYLSRKASDALVKTAGFLQGNSEGGSR